MKIGEIESFPVKIKYNDKVYQQIELNDIAYLNPVLEWNKQGYVELLDKCIVVNPVRSEGCLWVDWDPNFEFEVLDNTKELKPYTISVKINGPNTEFRLELDADREFALEVIDNVTDWPEASK